MIILSPVVLPTRYFLRLLPKQTRIELPTLITYVLMSMVEFYVLTLKFGPFYFLRRGRKPHESSTLNVTSYDSTVNVVNAYTSCIKKKKKRLCKIYCKLLLKISLYLFIKALYFYLQCYKEQNTLPI